MCKSKIDENLITWAALLHDIGKIKQKIYGVDKNVSHQEIAFNLLKSKNEKMASIIRKHHWERDDKVKKIFKDLTIEDNIVIISDRLSSSERFEEEGKGEYLISIFSKVFKDKLSEELDYKLNEKKYNKYPLYRIDDNFPVNFGNDVDYKIWDNINNLIENLDQFETKNFEKLLNALMVYTIYIPSDTYKRSPDISIYDHLKTTAAIAKILVKLYNDGKISEKELKNRKLNGENNYFSLIVGDLSGIQNFIFDVKTKKALKQIKARSFLLDFITEIYARYIVKKLDLTIANILYTGGGKFYILSYSLENIKTIEKEINEKLMKLGKVYLCLSERKFSVNELKNDIAKVFEEANENLEKAKKYYLFNYESIFEAKNPGNHRCAICNSFCDDSYEDSDDKEKICYVCYTCNRIYDIVFKSNKTQLKIDELSKIFDEFIPSGFKLKDLFPCEVYETDLSEEKYSEITLDDYKPILFYPIKKPKINNDNKSITFNDLAEMSEGVKKIGILKMDVDNLGFIFKEGLISKDERNYYSISRVSSLSTFLSIFFKYWVVKTATKDGLYVIYAGGDDSLIVGAWDKIFNFAIKVNKKFKEFCCYNPLIHLSAGLVITDPKSTFKSQVMLADEYLNKSKSNSEIDIDLDDYLNPFKKNSITVLDVTFNWDLYIYVNNEIKNYLDSMLTLFNKQQLIYSFSNNYYVPWLDTDMIMNNTSLLDLEEFVDTIYDGVAGIHLKKASLMKIRDLLLKIYHSKEKIDVLDYTRLLYLLEKNLEKNSNINSNNFETLKEQVIDIFDKICSKYFNTYVGMNNIKNKDILLLALVLRIKELKKKGEL